MRKLYFALIALACATMFVACKGKNDPDSKNSLEGKWIESASQVNSALMDDKTNKCWAIDLWCDGTTIGREFEWATEAQVAEMARIILTIDLQTFGRQTKKVMYTESKANDEAACNAKVWEGAECWEETISYGSQSETNFGWMPEANMKERHDYYQSKGLTHTYKRADAADQDACEKLNPEVPVTPPAGDKACWEITQNVNGQSTVNYVWESESYAQQVVSAVQMAGGTASYKKADANDSDACNALNGI
ncbi:MAG: hypothetical protein J6T80_01290 [Paludibacteraceae bacterium]|nr:hypothetical protein [Paludibacteraceae bacterium]